MTKMSKTQKAAALADLAELRQELSTGGRMPNRDVAMTERLDRIEAALRGDAQQYAQPAAAPCGSAWVAEIALCPVCGLGATAHDDANARRAPLD